MRSTAARLTIAFALLSCSRRSPPIATADPSERPLAHATTPSGPVVAVAELTLTWSVRELAWSGYDRSAKLEAPDGGVVPIAIPACSDPCVTDDVRPLPASGSGAVSDLQCCGMSGCSSLRARLIRPGTLRIESIGTTDGACDDGEGGLTACEPEISQLADVPIPLDARIVAKGHSYDVRGKEVRGAPPPY